MAAKSKTKEPKVDNTQAQFKLPKPQPKQEVFFRTTNKHVGYGGARGGGKSWAMRWKCIFLCLKYPGLNILLLRRTFPELEANHLKPLKMALKAKTQTMKNGQQVLVKLANYKSDSKTFEFANGASLKLGYCQYEADADQYQGHEYDVICFEEATRFTESQMNFISTCLRSPRPDFESRIYYTCNPGGPGHAFIKRLFIDKEYEENENPEDYSFVKSIVYDNEIIMKYDPSYVQQLNNLPEDLRRAHRDGDWDALAGQYFREFRKHVHVVRPFTIPKSWNWYISIDYGLDTLAVLFYAVDYNKNVYVTNEIHVKDLIVSQSAKLIKEYCKVIFGLEEIPTKVKDIPNLKGLYAPPDLNARQKDSGKSTLDLFYENGIAFDTTSNNRVAGWYNIKEMLYFEYEDTKNPSKGLIFKPIVHIFENCKFLIKHLPLAQRDEKKPEDIATEPHIITHILDAFRYFAVRFYKPPIDEAKPEIEKGTFWLEKELLNKGYTKAEINKMVQTGYIRLNSFVSGPPVETSIDAHNKT